MDAFAPGVVVVLGERVNHRLQAAVYSLRWPVAITSLRLSGNKINLVQWRELISVS